LAKTAADVGRDTVLGEWLQPSGRSGVVENRSDFDRTYRQGAKFRNLVALIGLFASQRPQKAQRFGKTLSAAQFTRR